MTKNQIIDRVKELNKASAAYYNTGQPIMSDYEFLWSIAGATMCMRMAVCRMRMLVTMLRMRIRMSARVWKSKYIGVQR